MEEIMSNQDYWQQRAERNLQAVEDIAVDYNLELAKEYKKVIKELQEELMLFMLNMQKKIKFLWKWLKKDYPVKNYQNLKKLFKIILNRLHSMILKMLKVTLKI